MNTGIHTAKYSLLLVSVTQGAPLGHQGAGIGYRVSCFPRYCAASYSSLSLTREAGFFDSIQERIIEFNAHYPYKKKNGNLRIIPSMGVFIEKTTIIEAVGAEGGNRTLIPYGTRF